MLCRMEIQQLNIVPCLVAKLVLDV